MSEQTTYQPKELAFREASFSYDAESRKFSGYGIVFNSDSVAMRVWDDELGIVEVREQITPDSLRDADMSDVIAAFNHNFEKILGRTEANTLTLEQDAQGVKYRFEVPETSYGNDLLVSSKRGDVRGSSFVFTMDWEEGYDISERTDGTLLAIPKKITRIYEMGPVVNPAYPETTAENRSGFLTEAVKNHLREKKAAEEVETREEMPEGPSEAAINIAKAKLRLNEEEAAL